jgi:hypothetical protein
MNLPEMRFCRGIQTQSGESHKISDAAWPICRVRYAGAGMILSGPDAMGVPSGARTVIGALAPGRRLNNSSR